MTDDDAGPRAATTTAATARSPDASPSSSALRGLLDEAARSGWNELHCMDADFAHWPLGEAEVLASLSAWVRPHRRLTLLACGYDKLARRHPRWVAWRRLWSHAVVCRQIEAEIAAADVPTLFIAPGGRMLRLLERRALARHDFVGRYRNRPRVGRI